MPEWGVVSAWLMRSTRALWSALVQVPQPVNLMLETAAQPPSTALRTYCLSPS